MAEFKVTMIVKTNGYIEEIFSVIEDVVTEALIQENIELKKFSISSD